MFKRYLRNIITIRSFTTSPDLKNIKNVRVRFAPSPTGFLHLGGLRTALYNYLFAKKHLGKFILRIEDTDQTRVVQGASEQIYSDLEWSGILVDEGPHIGGSYGPYFQSERMDLYREQVKKLLDNNTAYYCFCTEKRLELLRREAIRTRQTPKYDNRCRHLTKKEVSDKLRNTDKFCIRFKLSSDITNFQDLIYGDISYDVTQAEGDPIIMKSDGYPTYHFANVVDDHSMEISHVLRGVEWQISTTKHLMLYRAFGWTPPLYGHLPLLMNSDGSKLSKRQGDIRIAHYKESEIFPQALINYITTSGGGFEKDSVQNVKPQCFSMEELAEQFDIARISTASGKLKPERLPEFNRLEIERLLRDEKEEIVLVEHLQKLIRENFSDKDVIVVNDKEYVRTILNWSVNRITKLSDLISTHLEFLWVLPSLNASFQSEQIKIVDKICEILSDFDEWNRDAINAILRSIAVENDFPYKDLMKLLRSVLSGLKEGPSVAEMMFILGKENTLARLRAKSK